jgi:hypothetical protein
MKNIALLAALFAVTAPVGATDVGQHPAIFSPRSLPGIDPNTFIVGHPAGGAPGKAEQTEQPLQASVTPSRARSTAHVVARREKAKVGAAARRALPPTSF